ncbi:Rpn family recombination-promoting nuclease/putative transposase [Candidatus Tisiphia endosymbiont of Ceraclea dissimilis]|uniref:Rpn family recombination-promoting nuclease/putative transposase n=1 Tax=Candidatus Tisiphia endosymbiont of Ceraclea dissimilis TaxID=3077928 RepID=UPI003CCB6EC6
MWHVTAKEFLATHLPKDVLALIDSTTLKLEKDSFIESDLSETISDVLFSVKFNDQDGYIFLLLEHQSTVDKMMAFRLFKYRVKLQKRGKSELGVGIAVNFFSVIEKYPAISYLTQMPYPCRMIMFYAFIFWYI